MQKARAAAAKVALPNNGSVAAAPPAWEDPIPLDEPADVAPPFPLHLFPASVAELVRAVAESVYSPVDFPAVGCLAAASAAIGASFVAEIKPDFRQGAGLYLAVVGDPSVKKSPPLKHVLRPIVAEQAARVAVLTKFSEPPDVYEHGQGELYCSDVTVESLGELLHKQPRGLLLYRPELVGWLMAMNQYKAKGTGADRPFFLEVYDSDPITIHRVGRKGKGGGGIHVGRPSLTMVGATQPDTVRDFFSRRDGLAERILFAYPRTPPARGERWLTVPPDLWALWERRLQYLWAFKMRCVGDDRPFPNVLPLVESARPAWQEYTDRLAAVQNDPDFPARLRPAYGKLEGAAARLALVLQLLAAACGDASDADDGIADRWVRAGGELALYFGEHARRVQLVCGTDDRLAGASRILAWALGRAGEAFTRADLWRSLRNNPLFDRPESFGPPLKLLEQHHAIRWVARQEQAAGRPPSAAYEVNPKLLKPADGV